MFSHNEIYLFILFFFTNFIWQESMDLEINDAYLKVNLDSLRALWFRDKN